MSFTNVPEEVRVLAEEVYTHLGVYIWWQARNVALDRRSPEGLYAEDPARVLAYLEALADGNFA